MRIRRIAIGLSAVALLVAGCGGAEEEAAPAPAPAPAADEAEEQPEEAPVEPASLIYVGSAAVPGSTQIALWAVPSEMGFFEEEGLTVSLETADGSSAALQVVASGSADVTNSEVVSTVSAVAQGVPVTSFAGIVVNYPWRIGVLEGSSVQSAEDLRGKKVGIISLASGSNPFARAWMSENGLDPDSDVELIPVGGGPAALAAIESGEVDALAHYTELYATFANLGSPFRFLPNPALFDPQFSIALTSSSDLFESQPDVLARYGRALFKGVLFSAVNPEAAMRIGYKYFPEKLPESGDPNERVAQDANALKAWLESATPREGEPSSWRFGDIPADRWVATQEFAITAGSLAEAIDPDLVWNGSLIDEINDFDREAVIALAESFDPAQLD